MTTAVIEERIEAAAEKVWNCYLGSDGKKMTIGVYAESVEEEGEGVGMVRTSVLLNGAGILKERIEEFDEERFYCRYSVIERGPMPFADHQGQITVTPDGPDACILKLQADFTPAGMPEQDCIDLYMKNNYGGIERMKEIIGIKTG